jgi:hypothetical protein
MRYEALKWKLHWSEWLIVSFAAIGLFAMIWQALVFPGL